MSQTDEAAVAILRAAIATRRRGDATRGDLLYRVYVTVLLSLFGFYLALGLVDDSTVGVDEIDWIEQHGAAWIGLVAAITIVGGLRSGASGGPLAIDEANLHHLVMSPIDRLVALSPIIRTLLAGGIALGAVLGAASGELASRQLPGQAVAWVACGLLTGTTISLGCIGAALITGSSKVVRKRPWIISLTASLIIGWSILDIAQGWETSPGTAVGMVALWPIRFSWLAIAAPVIALGLVLYGRRRIVELSIERASRRAHLIRQVRFALAQQDIRSLILLRRQLGFERPRSRPMIRLSPGRFENRVPALYRDFRSYLRWPIQRVVRIIGLSVVAGIAVAGLWQGTTALAAGVAAVIYLAALEVVEPFSQELDHPLLLESAPIAGPDVLLTHLAGASIMMALFWSLASSVAALITGSLDLLAVLAVAALPAAACAVSGGAISTKRIGGGDHGAMLPEEVAGASAVGKLVWPLVLCGIGVAPVIFARDAVASGKDIWSATMPATAVVAAVAAAMFTWIRMRDTFAETMAEAKSGATRR
ncbi:MAG: hypothetical protein IH940_12295 [Acidobacteria bacterium]|nr:hypothetical protein [Acidobacteriota bacterium]